MMHVVATLVTLCLLGADFPICTSSNHQLYPCPLYENDQYYVFWTDYRNSPIFDLYGARITTDGTVIDVNGKFQYGDSVFVPRAAFDGTNFLVVYREGC